jgi:hypothetical protein
LVIMSACTYKTTRDWNVGWGPVRRQMRPIQISRFRIYWMQVRGQMFTMARCAWPERGRVDWDTPVYSVVAGQAEGIWL